MTDLTTRIVEILEQQQADIIRSGPVILGIATTAEKIMEVVAELGDAAVWNEAIEAAAKLFEPSCSCPEPCDDYWLWPSPCAKKAAERIRSLRRPDAAPARERPSGWRPIDTAPKDGSWIIVLSRDGCHVERISWGRSIRGHDAWLSATALVSYDLSGAWCGWMPCPARPALAGKEPQL